MENNTVKNKKTKSLMFVLICILLCVIGLNIYLFVRNNSSNNDEYLSNEISEHYNSNDSYSSDVEIAENEAIAVESYVIATKLNTNYVLDIAGADTSDGANLQLWERNEQYAQLFELRKNDNGYYQIIDINSGKALAAENGGKTEHTNVSLEQVGSSNSQYWSLVEAGNGYHYIIEKSSGLFLDVDNAWTENGTNIKLFSQNEAYEAQKWLLIEQ